MATAVKPRVKVAPERRGLTKVWNISDWPATSVEPQLVMVLGVSLAPGKAVEVPADRLSKAHKTMKDRDAGLISIGAKPPAEYLQAMQRRKRVRLPKGMARAHGPEAPKASEAKSTPPAKPEGAKKAPPKAGPKAAPKEESKGKKPSMKPEIQGEGAKKGKR